MKPNYPLIRLLVAKDWQLFQKPMAAFVLGGFVALCLLGMARPWAFYIGSLLLIIVLIAAACFSISISLLVERKEQTLAFVMSLPVSPLDFTLAKLAGNLLTFVVPFAVMLAGTLAVILYTPLPDGLVAYSLLIYGYVALAYSISLAVAMHVESEGWNTFAMITSMVLINPFIMGLGQIDSITARTGEDAIVFGGPTLAILATQALLSLLALAHTLWWHARKSAFY